ncbi:MAG: TlpA disulfide reductase family protein, partial [Gemmatimonadales bacterium]
FNAAYRAGRDSAALPGGKPLDVRALLAARTARTKACAAQFSIAATAGPGLLSLASLYSQVGEDSLAMAAVNKRLAEPGLTETDQASALAGMVAALTRPDTLVIARAEPYMKRLDALSDGVIMQKLDAHSRLNGEYRYLDVNDRIRQHSLAIIALGQRLKVASAADRSPGAVRSFTLLEAYTNLAEVYGDFGHPDSAAMMLDQATKDHPEIPPADADQMLKSERERYALVGQPAMTLEAGHWLNAPSGLRSIDPRGKVTVIEFTAHWCIPCRNSYPAMTAMADQFGKQGVQFIFATEFYGYLGNRLNLDAAAEFAADREYYVTEHGVHFPVAIAAAPPPYQPGVPYVPNGNDAHYQVGGIPQTVIIDRHGIIRRILTGWDTGNAERIPALLAVLLKEKSTRPTP